MLTEEPMTETTPQTQVEPMADGPVIVAPGAPGAIVQPAASGPEEVPEARRTGPGIEGEETVWEGHYSGRNFIGRMVFGGVLVAAWFVLLIYIWSSSQGNRRRRLDLLVGRRGHRRARSTGRTSAIASCGPTAGTTTGSPTAGSS